MFPSLDAAAPRVVDREEGIRGRGVVLAVGVGEEKPGAGTTVDLVNVARRISPSARWHPLCVPYTYRPQLSSSAPARRVVWPGQTIGSIFSSWLRFAEERKGKKGLLNP